MNSAKDDPLYRHGKHYDQQHGYLTDDIDFYLEQAKKLGQPILELACGTGRITIPIAKQGAEIVGLDISEQMLARAKEKAQQQQQLKIRWIHDDVRSFDLKQKFKLIIFTFNSIAHLHDHESIRSCLTSIRNHLHEEGRFIVHFFNPSLAILNQNDETPRLVSKYPDPDSENIVVLTETHRYDTASQINYIKWHYTIGNREFTHDLNMRIFFPQELDALLRYNGFCIENKFGDFDASPFTSESPKQVVVCKLHEKQD